MTVNELIKVLSSLPERERNKVIAYEWAPDDDSSAFVAEVEWYRVFGQNEQDGTFYMNDGGEHVPAELGDIIVLF